MVLLSPTAFASATSQHTLARAFLCGSAARGDVVRLVPSRFAFRSRLAKLLCGRGRSHVCRSELDMRALAGGRLGGCSRFRTDFLRIGYQGSRKQRDVTFSSAHWKRTYLYGLRTTPLSHPWDPKPVSGNWWCVRPRQQTRQALRTGAGCEMHGWT